MPTPPTPSRLSPEGHTLLYGKVPEPAADHEEPSAPEADASERSQDHEKV